MRAVLGHGLSPRKPGSVSRFSPSPSVHPKGCTPLPGSTRSSSLRVSQLALPVGSEGTSGPGPLFNRRPKLPVRSHVDVNGTSQVPRRSILCLCPALRPRPNRRSLASLTVSSMLPPRFPRQGLQRLMNFGALSRGFGTCCLRFKTGVATTPARLASGWLARLYREGVEPSGSLQKVSDHNHPPFLDLSWRKGSFILNLPLPSHHSITSSARASSDGRIVRPSAVAVIRLMTRSNLIGCSTGKLAGFAPRRILSTKSPARRNRSGTFAP